MKHALIIEDNHLIAMMIEQELLENGYESVEIATSQEQAVELAAIRSPDLITVDDRLDSGTGVDAIREICRHQTIPVVFITANSDVIKRSVSNPVVVPKPFWRHELAAGVAAALHAPMAC